MKGEGKGETVEEELREERGKERGKKATKKRTGRVRSFPLDTGLLSTRPQRRHGERNTMHVRRRKEKKGGTTSRM